MQRFTTRFRDILKKRVDDKTKWTNPIPTPSASSSDVKTQQERDIFALCL